jgi:hypothetical protein
MSDNKWFRLYHEWATDPKIQMLCEADQRRFVMVLCLRCSNGDVTLHDDAVAFQLRISNEEWSATKARLIAQNLIDEDSKPVAWSKRQYVSDTSKHRVSKHREQKKRTLQRPCNVTVTPPDTDTDTDTDTEEKTTTRAKSNAVVVDVSGSRIDLNELQETIEVAAGDVLAKSSAGLLSMATPLMWLENGCSLPLDIVPAIRQVAANRAGKGKISDWNYFTQAVANAKRAREKPLPEAVAGGRYGSPAKKRTLGDVLRERRIAEDAARAVEATRSMMGVAS